VAFVLLVATVYSLMSVCARLAYDAGSNALTVVALRSTLVGLALWAFLSARGIPCRLPPRDRWRALALGAVLAFGTFTLNKAIEVIPVTIAILIFYTYPLLTSILAWFTGTERFSLRVVVSLLLAFIGFALTLQFKAGPLSYAGLAYASVGAIGWGLLMFLSGRFFPGGDSRPRTLHMLLSAAALFALACALTGDIALPGTSKGWVGFVSTPLCYSFTIIGTMAAVSAIGAMKTSFYLNFEAVTTILFSAVILDQYLTAVQFVGAMLVILALTIFKMPAASAA
jgi:drug/metabolite transporter (DMT)-like permease